jgi:hypothetical protein
VSDILPGDDAAVARYTVLSNAIGGEPVSAYHKAVLARLTAWTDADDIDALDYLIRHQVGQVTQRFRSLLDEVAEVLATAVEAAPSPRNYGVVVEFPIGLARRVLTISGGGSDRP